MKETLLSYTELKSLVESDERSDHLAVTNIYLKELHAVARQNLVAATQESIALQLSAEDEENRLNDIIYHKPAGKKLNYQQQSIPIFKKKKKIYVCFFNGCHRKFKWLAHYRYHYKTHLGSKTFKCHFENCNRCFYTPQSLAVHRRTHTGEKPYVCPEIGCTRSFNTNGNLKNHIRTHTGEKPFSCSKDGCLRRFAELSSLKKHILVHSGQKPYLCNVCQKRFSQIGSRNVHMQRSHIEKQSPTSSIPENKLTPPNQMVEMETANLVMMSGQNSNDMFPVHGLRDDCVILSQPVRTNTEETQNPYSYHSEGESQEMLLMSSNYMDDFSDDIATTSKLYFKT